MFFKKRSSLKNLLPENYVDIHSHVLPGIDDGSKSIETSIKFLRELRELGFAKMIPTPHTMHGIWDNTPETIYESFMSLNDYLPEDIKDMIPQFASEYMVNFDFLKRISSENLLTFNDKNVLIEFSFIEAPKIIFDVISQLKESGYNIILAHPERYGYYYDQFFLYEELKTYDIAFQVNLLSTVGYYGDKVMKMADKLLGEGYIDYTGSDVHHHKHISCFNNKVKIKNQNQLMEAMNNNIKLLKTTQKTVRHSFAK